MNIYSKKEIELFRKFGFENLTEHSITPYDVYRVCITHAFVNKLEDEIPKACESLRRCYLAFSDLKVFRLTPEWDEMIIL